MYPDDPWSSSEHGWACQEGGRVRVGITQFAAEKMSDVVFIELPKVGAQVAFMQPFGVIESVKAVSDLFAPVSGTVVEVNTALANTPEVVNHDPYGQGWILLVEPKDAGELQKLMTPQQYRKVVGEEGA